MLEAARRENARGAAARSVSAKIDSREIDPLPSFVSIITVLVNSLEGFGGASEGNERRPKSRAIRFGKADRSEGRTMRRGGQTYRARRTRAERSKAHIALEGERRSRYERPSRRRRASPRTRPSSGSAFVEESSPRSASRVFARILIVGRAARSRPRDGRDDRQEDAQEPREKSRG